MSSFSQQTANTQEDPEAIKSALCKHLAASFVRRNNHYYSIHRPSAPMNGSDVKRLALKQFKSTFPELELTQEMIRDTFKRGIEEYHNDETQTIQVWDGSQVCRPDINFPIIHDDELVRLNTWSMPMYRQIAEKGQDMSLLTELLDKVFPEAQDRTLFVDWLSWCLQNESTKPGWAILLYSRRKGTGKSTLCSLVQRLFGDKNTKPVNGISKVTNRFNMPIVTSKLIIAEEVQLKHGTTQGNSLKTFVTEKELITEGKGKEAEKLPQCCCFLLTSNHFPSWIEAHERRYLVVEVDHSGHASGPDAAAFAEFVSGLHDKMRGNRNIAKLYNALMAYRQSNGFNHVSLNVAAIDTPIMQRVRQGATEVVVDQLIERLQARKVFGISQKDLIRMFSEELKTSSSRVAHLMREIGWNRHEAKWAGYGYSRVLWVHPDYYVHHGRVLGPNDYDEPIDPVAAEMEII